jgi:diguanylate cyclase (GGDEF)-like protein
MILFAVAVSSAIAVTDYYRLREQLSESSTLQMRNVESEVIGSLQTVEKAYYLFEQDSLDKMRTGSEFIADKYIQSPRFETWDFQQLKEQLGFDVYIINEQLTVIYSSYEQDVGLNFYQCCEKLANLLAERMRSGGFFHDGIDVEQSTGKVKLYSYMATRDKKFLIQLGCSLQETAFFQHFDFLKEIDRLLAQYPLLNEINVLNIGGIPYGRPVELSKLSESRRAAFERTLQSRETTEIRGEWNGRPAVFRYVYYNSEFEQGTGKRKILEIVYSDAQLRDLLRNYQKTFAFQLTLILVISAILSSLITRWVARPMHLAFHDSLTGLKNRAAFEEALLSALSGNKGTTALMMIDFDNFKEINDQLGHDAGDRFLQHAARQITMLLREKDIPARLGGDEFVVILPDTTKEQAQLLAEQIIAAMSEIAVAQEAGPATVSIGIAFAPEHGADPDMLCKNADIALYAAKEQGKSQYRLFPVTSNEGTAGTRARPT